MRRLGIFICLAGILLAGCGDRDDLLFPVEPFIELVATAPDSVFVGNDLVTDTARLDITLSFTDGDGDLGSDNTLDTTNFNFFIRDLRPRQAPERALIRATLPNLSSDARNPGIRGTITYGLTDLGHQDPVGLAVYPDTLVFELWVVDRAGNESNHVFTEPTLLFQQP